jgi:hypothetical protein
MTVIPVRALRELVSMEHVGVLYIPSTTTLGEDA